MGNLTTVNWFMDLPDSEKIKILEETDVLNPIKSNVEEHYQKNIEKYKSFYNIIKQKNFKVKDFEKFAKNLYNEIVDDNVPIFEIWKDLTFRKIFIGSSGIIDLYQYFVEQYHLKYNIVKKYFMMQFHAEDQVNTGKGEFGCILFFGDTTCKDDQSHGDFLYFNGFTNSFVLNEMKGLLGRLGIYNLPDFLSFIKYIIEKFPFINGKIESQIEKSNRKKNGEFTSSPVVRYIDFTKNINLKLSDREDFLKFVNILWEESGLTEKEFIKNFYYAYFMQFNLNNNNIQNDFIDFIYKQNIFVDHYIDKDKFWKTVLTTYIFLILHSGGNNSITLLNQKNGFLMYIYKDFKNNLELLSEIYSYTDFIHINSVPSMDKRSEVPQVSFNMDKKIFSKYKIEHPESKINDNLICLK